jgi:hypothetical protein
MLLSLHILDPWNAKYLCVCVCVCVCARARACVRVCVRISVCVNCAHAHTGTSKQTVDVCTGLMLQFMFAVISAS